jgi:hypothetical protein
MSFTVSLKPYCPRITRSKIAKLSHELRAAMNRVKYTDKTTWRDVVRKLDPCWKFEIVRAAGLSGHIAISKTHGIVVKCPYNADIDATPDHAIFTRTIPLKRQSYADDNEYIFIQPLADVTANARSRACELIQEAVESGEIENAADDDHDGNVAIFYGKAVAIDW